MQSSITDKVFYKNIGSYRYKVYDELCYIAFLNPELKDELKGCSINHPYFHIASDGIYVKKDYAWDGATYAINTKNLIIPSLVHDVCCQAISLGLLDRKFRKLVDKEYYLQSRHQGVLFARAMFHYICIRTYSSIYHKSDKNPAPFDDIHSVDK